MMRILQFSGLPLRVFQYRSPRHRAEFAFWVQVEGELALIPARARNISTRGIGAYVEFPIELGTLVTAVIPCGGDTVRLPARVKSGAGMARGLEFLHSSEEETRQIGYAVGKLAGIG